MTEFQVRGMPDGRLSLGYYGRTKLIEFLKGHPQGVRMTLSADLPESGKLRRWYEGCVVALATYYQEGLDHRSYEDRRKVRSWLAEEFNGEMVMIGGEMRKVARSSKGRAALNPLVERVVEWLKENYEPPMEALDPEAWKHWNAAVYPYSEFDNYIDYLSALKIL